MSHYEYSIGKAHECLTNAFNCLPRRTEDALRQCEEGLKHACTAKHESQAYTSKRIRANTYREILLQVEEAIEKEDMELAWKRKEWWNV